MTKTEASMIFPRGTPDLRTQICYRAPRTYLSAAPRSARLAICRSNLSSGLHYRIRIRVRPPADWRARSFYFHVRSAASRHLSWTARGNSNTGLTHLNTACFPIPVPEVDEQRAIAAFLDRETAKIDALVARKERLIELLQEKRTALITRAVTRGLDPNVPMKDSGVEWLGEIPAHWEPARLWRLRAARRAAPPPRRTNPAYWNGDVPWVSPKDMKRRVISTSEDLITQQALNNGDQTRHTGGRSCCRARNDSGTQVR